MVRPRQSVGAAWLLSTLKLVRTCRGATYANSSLISVVLAGAFKVSKLVAREVALPVLAALWPAKPIPSPPMPVLGSHGQ